MAERLTPDRWRQAAALLDQLLDAPDGDRATRLAELARQDPDLAADVRSLLEAETREGILDSPAQQFLATLVEEIEERGGSPSRKRRRAGGALPARNDDWRPLPHRHPPGKRRDGGGLPRR